MIAQDKTAARCHWHSLVEAVGNCAACGRAGCGTCLVQEAGGYRCQECIRKGRQIIQSAPVQSLLSTPMPATAPGQGFAMLPQPSTSMSLPPIQPVSPQPAFGRVAPKSAKILVSLVVFLAGAAIPQLLVKVDGAPDVTLSQHFWSGYVLWALFWGAPAAWRMGRKIVGSLFSFGCGGLWLGFGIAWFTGWCYCLLGGGIYQFARHCWSLTQPTFREG